MVGQAEATERSLKSSWRFRVAAQTTKVVFPANRKPHLPQSYGFVPRASPGGISIKSTEKTQKLHPSTLLRVFKSRRDSREKYAITKTPFDVAQGKRKLESTKEEVFVISDED